MSSLRELGPDEVWVLQRFVMVHFTTEGEARPHPVDLLGVYWILHDAANAAEFQSVHGGPGRLIPDPTAPSTYCWHPGSEQEWSPDPEFLIQKLPIK